MAKVAKARAGKPVTIKARPIAFSYWPTYRTNRRYGLHSHVYATNPWALIQVSVRANCPAAARDEALSSLEQAEFFYRNAVSVREWAAKPLPLYYSFMNLAKAFALVRGIRPTFDRAQHGVSEQLGPGGKELQDAYLEVYPSPGQRGPNIFSDFRQALGGGPVTAKTSHPLSALLPQVVPGHRIWCDAADAEERFFAIEAIPFSHTTSPKEVWSTTLSTLLPVRQSNRRTRAPSAAGVEYLCNRVLSRFYHAISPTTFFEGPVRRIRRIRSGVPLKSTFSIRLPNGVGLRET